MNKNCGLIRAGVAVGALSVGVVGIANAEDNKAYLPGFCRATSGSITYGSYGEIYNASTSSSLSLNCPIVRENQLESVEEIEVTIRDRNANAGQDVSCHVRYRTPAGSVGTSSTTLTPGGGATSSGGFQSMELYGGDPDLFLTDFASIMLVCTLPPAASASSADRSAIFRYRVEENP